MVCEFWMCMKVMVLGVFMFLVVILLIEWMWF